MTRGNLWNYYRGKIDDIDGNASQGKSFKYKIKIMGKAPVRPPQRGNPGDADQPKKHQCHP